MFDSDYMFVGLAFSGLSWVLKKIEAEVSIFLLLMTEFDTFNVCEHDTRSFFDPYLS